MNNVIKESTRLKIPEQLIHPESRVAMTLRCRDADEIPKVENAGEIAIVDGFEVQIMHNGLSVVRGGYYGDFIERIIRHSRGHHEPQEERCFYEVMKHIGPNATMIELGAFWCYFTLWFMQGHLGRRAVAIEPDAYNREVGAKNAALNRLSPLLVEGFAGRATTDPQPFGTEHGIQNLRCFSVETLMQMGHFDHLDILHCDAQGAELEVLYGCANIFREGRVSWCCISTHGQPISGDWLTHQRCIDVLQKAGATIVVEHDVHESFSGDGFILAKFGEMPAAWTSFTLTHNRYSESLFRNPIYDLAIAPREP